MSTSYSNQILNVSSSEYGVNNDRIVILDAGSQYAKVIDRKIRELKVNTDIKPLNTPALTIKKCGYKGIIISGGPSSINDTSLEYNRDLFRLNIPILGICYGMHIINKELGGTIIQKDAREDGQQEISIEPKCPLFKDLFAVQTVLLTHGDSIDTIGTKLKIGGVSKSRIIQAVFNEQLKIYGVQFHPEVDLTLNGNHMLSNFLFEICELTPNFTMQCRKEFCINYIRDRVGVNKKVLVLVSGGVDSTVCASIVRLALPPQQIIALHIDNGLLRANESELVCKSLRGIGIDLIVKDCYYDFIRGTTKIQSSDELYFNDSKMLAAVIDPEEKRKIIGDTFIRVTTDVLNELKLNHDDVYFAQGTLRPDLIESASKSVSNVADTIKTHHNDSELVRKLRKAGRVLEPLSDFHKDEVKEIGYSLGLPANLIERHPFPGPGLAIRILCGDEPYMESDFSETQVIARVICDYYRKSEKKHALLGRVSACTSDDEQVTLKRLSKDVSYTATLLPIKSVGVQGDHRTYSYVIGLSSDSTPNWEDLAFLAKLIPRILHNINRVCYIFGGPVEHPVTELTPTRICTYTLTQLRRADEAVNKTLHEYNCLGKISQMPVVLIPIHFDRDLGATIRVPSGGRSIVLRPFMTKDFMTGVPAIPGSLNLPLHVMEEMVKRIKTSDGISRVLFDLTPKPPGTTEWE